MRLGYLIAVVFLYMSCAGALLAEDRLNIRTYTSRNGLSQNTVRCIMQDSLGFVWLGTTNGISRYDGHRFKVLMPAAEGKFGDNRINNLEQDDEGRIWVYGALDTVICCYCPDEGKFAEAAYCASRIRRSTIGRTGLAERKAVARRAFGDRVPEKVRLMQYGTGFALFADSHSGKVWIYDMESDRTHVVECVTGGVRETARYRAVRTRDGIYWIITMHHGLVRYNGTTGVTRRFTMRDGLSSNNLRSIMLDRAGDLWIGTNERGVMHVILSDVYVRDRILDAADAEGNTMEIRMAFADSDGRRWFGAHNTNNNVYISHKETVRTFVLPGGNAYCALELPGGDKLIGTKGGGIYRADAGGTRVVEKIGSGAANRQGDDVYGMALDGKQRLWAATHGDGVQVYVPHGDSYRYFRTFRFGAGGYNQMRSIVKDVTGRMWTATNNGIVTFNPDSLLADATAFRHVAVSADGVCANGGMEVRSIFIDRHATLWIGTTGFGLFRADLTAYPKLDIKHVGGTPNSSRSIIQSMAADSRGRIWVAAENHLFYVSRTPHAGQGCDMVAIDVNDDVVFSENSMFVAGCDSIFAGCDDGVVVIDAGSDDMGRKAGRVYFSALQINGAAVYAGTAGSPLDGALNDVSELLLRYWQNSIKLDCTVFDFRADANAGYYYCLHPEGGDSGVWTSTGGNSIILNELHHGTYILRVKCDAGLSSDEERVLKIVISPPWWQTWWAYTLYAAVAAAMVWLVVRQWTKRQRERTRIAAERSLAEYKLQFFSRVSHDLRTPLTVIQGYLDMASDNGGSAGYRLSPENMGILHRNADKLLALIDKVLSFNASHAEEEQVRRHIVGTAAEADALFHDVPEGKEMLPEEGTAGTDGYRILVIDDNRDMLDMLFAQLGRHFTVYTCESGSEALALLGEVQPDLIVCDVMMPGMSGIEFTRRLREDFNICHIPVILLTASVGEETHLKGIKVGADAFLTKPFNSALLYARIIGLVEQRRRLQSSYATSLEAASPLVTVADRDKAFVERLNDIIAENMGNSDFRIEDYAHELNVGRTTLFAKIKAVLGYTPHEYVRLLRMKKAAELLLSTDLNVSEICYKVGINDPFYFSRLFKQVYGKAPSQYRKG